MRTKTTTAIAAAGLIAMLAGCGDDSTSTGSTSSGSSEAAATTSASAAGDEPDTNDSRAFADWAVTKLLTEQTTDICQYASDGVKLKFAKVGWCETNPSFPETPTVVTLLGECAYTNSKDGYSGQLYYYKVQPTITWNWPSIDTGNAVEIVVSPNGTTGQLTRVQPIYTQENDATWVAGCEGSHVSGATATIPLD